MSAEKLHAASVSIPKIGLGTYRLTGEKGRRSIETAIDLGYRHIDTAKLYENEAEVGKAIRNTGIDRSELFLTTKIWTDDFPQLVQATEDALRRLELPYVDLLLLHWPLDETANRKALDALNEVLHRQYTKHVGVSNFTVSQLETALQHAPVVCNQVEYHPFLSQDKQLDFLRKNGLFLTAYRPLANGAVATDPLLVSLGEKYGKTPGQIALRRIVQQGAVAVPKAASPERQRENLDVFDFALSEEDMEAIAALPKDGRLVNPAFAPRWD